MPGMGATSIIWAAVMPLLIAILIPFAANGSAMGGIIPLILYLAITPAISYGMVHCDIRWGVIRLSACCSGANQRTGSTANVLGLIMMGALSASYVKINMPLKN
ncbi:PTS system mannose/fructose/sorbose family transporter subunit IID [Salmonella enterica subsp. enterica]|nr:PTS system mannose/fructose/sorbose family transporter subunit IID [Salmonella enterica subsp. enterica]